MIRRYLSVFRNHVILMLLLLALIIFSSRTNGRLSVYTSVFTGILMIYAAIVFTIWIIRTPSKKNKDEGI
jgi:Ca2+/Na+ antiporter